MKTITQKEILELYDAAKANAKAISVHHMRRSINCGTFNSAKCFSVQVNVREVDKTKVEKKFIK